MSVEKPKESSAKKVTTETKVVEAKAEPLGKTKSCAPENKSDTRAQIDSKPDAKAKKQDMGEGQKAVSKAYKDNWNDIFAKKKKR
jgi:hypothetical protein